MLYLEQKIIYFYHCIQDKKLVIIFIENKNIKLSTKRLASIICCSDLFAINISSTIIWAILLGIPCVIYDPLKIKDTIFEDLNQSRLLILEKIFENLKQTELDKELLDNDWNILQSKVFGDDLSLKYIQLFDSILNNNQFN